MIPMDKICKAYVSQVKAILPVWGKKEKAFVKKLHNNLYDYCEDKKITAIDKLYKDFGTPQEFVFNYISLIEPDVISKRINTAKYIRMFVIGLLALITIATSALCITLYSEYQYHKRYEAIGSKTTIIEYN